MNLTSPVALADGEDERLILYSVGKGPEVGQKTSPKKRKITSLREALRRLPGAGAGQLGFRQA